jgi:hypothetical protein
MPTFHKVELQKSLVALRKAAMDFGIKKLEIAEATKKVLYGLDVLSFWVCSCSVCTLRMIGYTPEC